MNRQNLANRLLAVVRYVPEALAAAVVPVGTAWLVEVEGPRPNNTVRRSRLLDGVEVVEDLVESVCCGVLCAVRSGVTYMGHAVAVVEADRVVNDHPDYLVTLLDGTPARVAYVREALVPVCPQHNGSGARDLVRDELSRAAAWRLDRMGRRLA